MLEVIDAKIQDFSFSTKNLNVEILKRIKNGIVNRKTLVAEFGIARTTIFDQLKKMVIKGILKKYSIKYGKIGRPFVFFELTDDFKNKEIEEIITYLKS